MIDFLKGTITPRDWAINGIVVALAVAVCVAFAFLVVMPGRDSLDELKDATATAKDDLRLAQQTSANIDQLVTDRDKMKGLVDEFEKQLPTIQEIPTLLRTFERFADEIGLRLDLVSDTPKLDMRKETRPYKVDAQGDFHQIATFINLLESSERYFKISDLSIDKQTAGVSEAAFVLSTYRFIEPAEGMTQGDESEEPEGKKK